MSSLSEQAKRNARLQTADERQALADQLKEAHRALVGSQRAARTGATLIQNAVSAARPEVVGAYKDAGNTIAQANAKVTADLAKLGSGADPFRAAVSVEEAGARSRLATAMAHAAENLGSQKVQAAQGAVYQSRQALGAYAKTASDVASGRRQVARKTGALAQQQLDSLTAAQAKATRDQQALDIQQSRANEQATHDRAMEHNARVSNRNAARRAAAGNKPSGLLAPAGRAAALSRIQRAAQEAQKYAGHLPASKIIQYLSTGVGSHLVLDPKTGKAKNGPDGKPDKTDPIPKVGSADEVRAGLELATRGYITQTTATRLRSNVGIVVPKNMRDTSRRLPKGARIPTGRF